MDNKTIYKRIAAGAFFLVSVGLISVSIFMIGINRGLTQQKFKVITLFNEAGGLIEGAPIRISGINVGLVGSVEFLDQKIEGRSIKVTMDIFKKYEFQFRKCGRVSIRTEGVLGQKLVEINEDRTRPVFDMSRPIIGEDPLDVEDMAAVLTRTAMSVQKTSEGVGTMMNEWQYISRKTRRVVNRIEEKLIDGDLFKIF